jgi:hypothetical protein
MIAACLKLGKLFRTMTRVIWVMLFSPEFNLLKTFPHIHLPTAGTKKPEKRTRLSGFNATT